MEANVMKQGATYNVQMTLSEEDLDTYLEDNASTEQPGQVHAATPPMFASKHFCVTVVDASGRGIYQETIKTHPAWAPVRAFAIMRGRLGGQGYQMRSGQC